MSDDDARPNEGDTEETRTLEARTPDPATEAPKPTETVDFWKAMSRKNEKAAKELEALKAAQLSKEERVGQEAAEAKAEAARANAEAMRQRYARTVPDITDEEVELFLTGTDEETLIRQAEKLNERAPQLSKGTHVPNLGQQPTQPPSPNEQIAAAEAEGDYRTALQLKSQMIADLAHKNH